MKRTQASPAAPSIIRVEIEPRDRGRSAVTLHIGRKCTGISVYPDVKWPQLYRIHRGDWASDMVNLARAEEAAIAVARPRGLGRTETISWNHRETPPASSRIAQSGRAA